MLHEAYEPEKEREHESGLPPHMGRETQSREKTKWILFQGEENQFWGSYLKTEMRSLPKQE